MTKQNKIDLQQVLQEARITASMVEGCKNRMCICDTEEELDKLFIGIMIHAQNLYKQNQRRLFLKQHPAVVEPTDLNL